MSNSKRKDLKKAFAAAFPCTIPVLTGFLLLGMAYGVLMQKNGYGVLWAGLMSAVAFCGSMQFAAIPLLVSAFNPIQAFLLSLMVNARHLFYGVSMLDKYKGLGKARLPLIYMLCDETFSIASSVDVPKGINKKYFYLFISVLDYLYWFIATIMGSVLGRFITINTKGLDFVLTALFVVLLIEQFKKKENIPAGVIGIVASALCLLVFGAQNMVIYAMIIILLILILGRNKL